MPITVLGKTFNTDEERREYFREELRQHLPELKQLEGFPIGEDEDIIALSDPPYYTACTNPWLNDFIAEWEEEKEHQGEYHRNPFATDVSEGKTGSVYSAHSYHTKVPHKAIMRYILHYTEPGDIVFDGFCGTGMTGVAAQFCGDKNEVLGLGYYVDQDGNIFLPSRREGNSHKPFAKIGARNTILSDLSPSATFIAGNYNLPVNIPDFVKEAKKILYRIKQKYGWMYETIHKEGRKGIINYTVWSEVFNCPQCSGEIIYYNEALDQDTFKVKDTFSCPHCQVQLKKKDLDRAWETYIDPAAQDPAQRVKRVPVLINYQIGDNRLEKTPDEEDIKTLKRIESAPWPDWYPKAEMLDGERKGKDGYHLKGISHIHHFYFKRTLIIFQALWEHAMQVEIDEIRRFLIFYFQSRSLGFTKLNRFRPHGYSQVNQVMSGAIFVSSLIAESSPWYALTNKLKRLEKFTIPSKASQTIINTGSTSSLFNLKNHTVDYIFIDPPFGNNLHYSELNFFWESWLKVWTNRAPEAVMDNQLGKSLLDYQHMMRVAFEECYRILKPGRWMTVEFHNSRNSVWNVIQEGIIQAGFIVADVRTLDKKQETYKQSVQKLVKADLVISAYKPLEKFTEEFNRVAGTESGVWAFIEQHLQQLPIYAEAKGKLEVLVERQSYLLFDRMIAYHLQKSLSIPMSFSNFTSGLMRRYPERDDMYFLPNQVDEYEKKRMEVGELEQLTLFVNDEKSAIQWLKQQLDPRSGQGPQTYQELYPKYTKEAHASRYDVLPELKDLLDQNFILDLNGYYRTPDFNEANDLEIIRNKQLLKQFAQYTETARQPKGKLKEARVEALRAGFKQCYKEKDFKTIVDVADCLERSRRSNLVMEDEVLLQFYDIASTRV